MTEVLGTGQPAGAAAPTAPATAPAPASAPVARTTPHPAVLLLILGGAAFMASLDLFIVNIAFPDIQRSFGGTSNASLSWVLNAYAIVFAALPVPLGRLADMVGRRRVFVAGVALFVAASALCALAPSVGWLVAFRAVQAVGAAALLPTSLGLLLINFPSQRRAAAVAIWAACGSVAAAAGPPLGGVLVQASWHWVFLVNLPIGALIGAGAVIVLGESRDRGDGRLPDLAGAAVLIAGVAAVTLGIVKGPDWGWGDARTVGALVGGLVLLAVFVRRCARHPVPVIELDLLEKRSFSTANLAAFVYFAGFSAMLLSSVLFLTGVWGESVTRAGLMFAPGPAAAALTSLPGGKLAARIGYRPVAVFGAALTTLGGLLLYATVDTTPDYLGGYLWAVMITGAGVGFVIPSLAGSVTSELAPNRAATGSAVFAMSRQLGSAFGVAVMVALLGTPGPGDPLASYHRVWWFLIGSTAATGLVCLVLRSRSRAVAAVRGYS